MDEALYYRAYMEEYKSKAEKLEEENIKLRNERDILQYKLEDVISDTKEDLWRVRREIDEKISDLIEVLEDMQP